MSTLDHVWPNGLTESLWNYEALQPPRSVPFMNLQPSASFLLASVAGAAIIVLFAVRRFNTHSSEPGAFEYRALRELNPMDLRAAPMMWQAYVRYVGVLLAIYVALTLFGELVLGVINSLPSSAGLQVNPTGIDFDSPQWPLLISFGIAGFVPMLKPMELLERRLRAWAHRSAGIPIRITQQTNRVRRALDELTGPAPDFDHAPAWLDKIAPVAEQRRAFKTRAQLQHLLNWSRDQRPYWPSAKTRAVLSEIEREETQAALATLEAFDDLLIESFDRITMAGQDVRAQRRQGFAEAAAAFSGPASAEAGTPFRATGPSDALLRHRRRLEREWNELTQRMEALRDELASMLAIFAEHDERTDEIEDKDLRTVVRKACGDRNLDDGPVFWLYLSLVPVAAAYYAVVQAGHHSLISNLEPNWITKGLTVLLNTAKVAIQFCIPLSVVLSWRYARRAHHNSWIPIDLWNPDRAAIREILRAAGLALVTGIVLLALFGLLWAALISRTEAQFLQLYVMSQYPYAAVFATQALIAVATTTITLLALEHARLHPPRSRWALAPFGLLNALAVLLLWSAHTGIWYGFQLGQGGCEPEFRKFAWSLLSNPFSACFGVYDGTDLYVYAALAFCSACLFIPADRSERTGQPRSGRFDGAVTRLRLLFSRALDQAWPRRVLLLLAAGVVVFLSAGLLAAQERAPVGGSPAEVRDDANWPRTVRVGFRSDVEPFSFFDEAENRFRGYLADLCYRIFEAGAEDVVSVQDQHVRYTVLPVEVKAQSRFDSFSNSPKDPASERIDVLCDPTTLRFSADDGRDGGVFSPIVFVSGVSYLHRRPDPTDGSVVLGYVSTSTALDVARRACNSDLFRVGTTEGCASDEKTHKNYKQCDRRPSKSEAESPDTPDSDAKKYIFCAFSSHTEAITWFCNDGEGRQGTYPIERAYFGDRDIIVGKLESRAKHVRCGGAESSFETYTYEPYALVVRKDDIELVRFVQRRVYQIFSNRDEIAAIFSANFGGKTMTRQLANLFLINAVDLEEGGEAVETEEDGEAAEIEEGGESPEP